MVVYEVIYIIKEDGQTLVESYVFDNFKNAKELFLSLYEEYKDEEYTDEGTDFENQGECVGFNENGEALYLRKKKVQ